MIAVFLAIRFVMASRGFAWRRLSRGRSDRRSVEDYGRALDRLGSVARRNETGAPTRFPEPAETGLAHLRPAPPERRNGTSPRARSASPSTPTAPPIVAPTSGRLVFGDDDRSIPSITTQPIAAPTLHDGPEPATAYPSANPARPELTSFGRAPLALPPVRGNRARRAAGVAAAVVVVAAVTVGLFQLPGGHAKPPAAKSRSDGSPVTSAPPDSTTTTVLAGLPSTLTPTASSATTVSYALALTGAYRVTFSTSGRCWVGIQSTIGNSYLWMQTLGIGESGSYNATGSIVVRIGAPSFISIAVNGTPVNLPKGRSQPYDIVLDETG